ncbi:hypothetical protein [Seonamhaeicola sp.]|uniref:hypothetical protein n=1 Tax=Seonamhaeicola sp. TaxID=1912245 RepID=UPI00260E8141|nr:hypothetical protein [Seonamhaeicola sp.]
MKEKEIREIPRNLKSVVPIQEISKVEDWWNKLSKENQIELESVYKDEPENQNQFVAIHLCGKFVEQEKTNNHDVFWVNHFYEYIVNHEIIIDQKPKLYVCSAYKEAENAIRTGIIKKEFLCPELNKNCQMRKILDLENGEKSLQFFIRFKLEKEHTDYTQHSS